MTTTTGTTTGTEAPEVSEALRPPRERSIVYAAGLSVLVLVVILGVWQAAVSLELMSTLILPAPASVAAALKDGLFSGDSTWFSDIWVTLKSTFIGFALGCLSALVLGTVLAYVRVLRMALYPFVIFFQTFPKIAIAPLLVAYLGYGAGPKIVIGALLAFFPMFTNTVTGMSEVDRDEVRLLRSFGASKLQELRFLRLPNSLPYIFAAMDVALVVSLLGVIVGEFVGASAGLGFRIQDRTAFGDTASVYAVLLILGVLGTLLHVVMVRIKNLVVFHE